MGSRIFEEGETKSPQLKLGRGDNVKRTYRKKKKKRANRSDHVKKKMCSSRSYSWNLTQR